jgi:hypothetical protein
MKTSELISKLQKSIELFGDNEIVCELQSSNKWYSEKEWSKTIYGHLGIGGNKTIIFV